MLTETVEFNVSVLVAQGGPNCKPTFFPIVTCRNESVEIAPLGFAAGRTEKGSPVFVIVVKDSKRGAGF